jgi:hypothetical protein
MIHVFVNDPAGSTPTDVLWQCSRPACGVVVGFKRKGFGEPWGSETEIPKNAADYVGPCIPDEPPPSELEDLKKRVTILEEKMK